MFRTIAEACVGLDVQLVMGLGGGLDPEQLGTLPGNPLVLSYVPQIQLLERAAVMVTHAGMNSALECLSAGVPTVAVPITHDQPTIAQRIVWTRTGEMVAPGDVTAESLRSAIRNVTGNPLYRDAALRLKEIIRSVDGVTRAADIVETIITTGQPVLREMQGGATHSQPS